MSETSFADGAGHNPSLTNEASHSSQWRSTSERLPTRALQIASERWYGANGGIVFI